MIAGYPHRASVAPGERLVLHVATDAPRFRVRFFRWSDGFTLAETSAWFPGRNAAARPADADWDWPSYEFPIAKSWPSGVYVALLDDGENAQEPSFDAPAALFVVRGAGRSDLLYKLPLATYHAYNYTGGGCFYVDSPRSLEPPGSKVSLRRPGGGIGGETWGAADYYDPTSARQTFAHWDAPFIRWLAQRGYEPEFCIDFDLHDGILDAYPKGLLLSVGHDEYWSDAMRDGVESFVRRGGNVAFFGANLCWWRIHVVDDDAAIVCHQGGPKGAFDHWWPPTGARRPEDALGGVSYRHGGGWWDGPRTTRGFIVQDPEHWIFAGTGLRRGDAFGAQSVPPLVGYECDGAPVEEIDRERGLVTLSPHAAQAGTPESFRILAAARLTSQWQELPKREPVFGDAHYATIGVFTRGGTVFTAATTDWAQVLTGGSEPHVETITRNVIEGLRNEAGTFRAKSAAR